MVRGSHGWAANYIISFMRYLIQENGAGFIWILRRMKTGNICAPSFRKVTSEYSCFYSLIMNSPIMNSPCHLPGEMPAAL